MIKENTFGLVLHNTEQAVDNGDEVYLCSFNAKLDKKQYWKVLSNSKFHETMVQVID